MWISIRLILFIVLAWLLSGLTLPIQARELDLPTGSDESIEYWFEFVVDADQDPQVALAHKVYKRLLNTWNNTRMAPALYVVKSTTGAWAASLDDGSILLSRAAIEICLKDGEASGVDRLAFVLGHELAHQAGDDLWHRRFFRLAGQQSPSVRDRMLSGLDPDQLEIGALEQKEAQADQDGLTRMALVGFDPVGVVGDQDFFQLWVESIWASACGSAGLDQKDACAKARARKARARARLLELGTHAVLFDLGVQAYSAGEPVAARAYFLALGRDFPGRAVHLNIGLTHIGEAQMIGRELTQMGEVSALQFIYPLKLEAESMLQAVNNSLFAGWGVTRGVMQSADPALLKAKKMQRTAALEQAVHAFERAIQIDPGHQRTYINLISAYLMAGNVPMARGILQGKYHPKFGSDNASELLLALVAAREGDTDQAVAGFRQLMAGSQGETGGGALTPERYCAGYNTAVLMQMDDENPDPRIPWKDFLDWVRTQNDVPFFPLGDKNLTKLPHSATPIPDAVLRLSDMAPGDLLDTGRIKDRNLKALPFRFRGAPYLLYHAGNGERIVIVESTGRIIGVWRQSVPGQSGDQLIGVSIPDIFTMLGSPDRRVLTSAGTVLAYDRFRLGLRLRENTVIGWFRYPAVDGAVQ